MQIPSLQLLVTHPDESAQLGPASTYIPTIGHVGTAIDAYRTAAVHSIIDKPALWCLTDTDAGAALGRVIDGPIQSYTDIERAEGALRAILLNDFVEIVVPCVKAEHSKSFVSYARLDQGERGAAAFDAFNIVPCRDLLLATELLSIRDGVVVSSSNASSLFLGQSQESFPTLYRQSLSAASEVASSLPLAFGASSYYTSPELSSATNEGMNGFINELYLRINRPWMDVVQATPPLYVNIPLPPLLAIVLSRASNRSNIPVVLRDLRQELAAVRLDLINMNSMLERSLPQADINAYTRKITESFNAIVPETLLTDAERRKRALWSVFNFLKPVPQLYSIAVDPLSIDRDKLAELIGSARAAVASNSRLVSRSVSAAVFSELLRVESLRNSVLTHFSDSEIRSLSNSRVVRK